MTKINFFPETTTEEIMQNIQTLLSTRVGTVPLDRKLGLNGTIIDNPINKAKERLVIDILETIQEYEPRVEVTDIGFVENTSSALDGIMYPKVKVRVKDEYIR